ncbi:MAG: IS110 family transposase [Chloroflexi bacterium RBG_19FT_COMBO_56_12]|nr:MAG: IS110 family transposase [Chloroflexi bacterium RBG_19FT_COMBO_56_12]
MAKQKQKKIKPGIVNALEQINLNAAGIDIGAEEVWVAVPPDRDEVSVRSFPTFTADLHRLADWLEACRIGTVAMEATGVYWIPLFEILEARGFQVYLVNARHLKNVSGRKTDVLDCQWIQQLHTYGLLSPSFRPPDQIVALRSLVRHREMLVQYRSAHIQHMQKALTVMNLRLTSVLSDISGVTGMQIIRSIVAGERDSKVLAQFRDERCNKSEAEIAKALEGHYKREQVFALKQAVELYDFYDRQLRECDAELEAMYQKFDPPESPGGPPPAPRTKKRRKNQAYFDLAPALYRLTGVDLTQIDGVDELTIQKVLSEVGTDMSQWPTVKHFASWLRLCPNNKITGGKVKQTGVQPTQNRASTALRVAAASLHHSDSALGAYYRRMRARHGAPAAITATAHKLARIIYFMLKERKPYHDLGADYYEQQHRARVLRNLNRQAAKLGFRLEPAALGVS